MQRIPIAVAAPGRSVQTQFQTRCRTAPGGLIIPPARIFAQRCHGRLCLRHVRNAASIYLFLVVKPNQPVVLKIVIDGQNRDDGNRFVRHRRQ